MSKSSPLEAVDERGYPPSRNAMECGINYSFNIHRNSKKVSDKYPKDERELG
jgi:hypothetical protein